MLREQLVWSIFAIAAKAGEEISLIFVHTKEFLSKIRKQRNDAML